MTFNPADLDVIQLHLLSVYLPNSSSHASVHVSVTFLTFFLRWRLHSFVCE